MKKSLRLLGFVRTNRLYTVVIHHHIHSSGRWVAGVHIQGPYITRGNETVICDEPSHRGCRSKPGARPRSHSRTREPEPYLPPFYAEWRIPHPSWRDSHSGIARCSLYSIKGSYSRSRMQSTYSITKSHSAICIAVWLQVAWHGMASLKAERMIAGHC